jgi:hypothetical protein
MDSEKFDFVGRFVVDHPTPSLNQVMRWVRGESWRYAKIKTAISQWVMITTARMPRPTGRRHIRIVRTYRSERYRLDQDNFIGGCKCLVDAMIYHDVIIEDSDEHATIEYDQEKQTSGKTDWVEVEVWDYKEGTS